MENEAALSSSDIVAADRHTADAGETITRILPLRRSDGGDGGEDEELRPMSSSL